MLRPEDTPESCYQHLKNMSISTSVCLCQHTNTLRPHRIVAFSANPAVCCLVQASPAQGGCTICWG